MTIYDVHLHPQVLQKASPASPPHPHLLRVSAPAEKYESFSPANTTENHLVLEHLQEEDIEPHKCHDLH